MNQKIQQGIAGISFMLILFALVQLGGVKRIPVVKAVYSWKTHFEHETYRSSYEDSFISKHQIRKLYVKVLDVDYSESAGIFPANKTDISYYGHQEKDSTDYIPVIYITNRVLQHLKSEQLDYYAKNILGHALRLETHTEKPVHEIQIDCDWTKGTREIYFDLLKCIQKWGPQYQYSVTLRLYPFKYREELGIPPVQRVMLMVYNIDNAKKFKPENSIFNVNEAALYLKRIHYPLPMDFALPVFSWTLVFRNQQFLKVLSSDISREITENPYVGNSRASKIQKLNRGHFLVLESPSPYNAYNLKAGDILKVESCGEKELMEARILISRFPITPETTIALFDLDKTDLEKISDEKIEAAFTSAP